MLGKIRFLGRYGLRELRARDSVEFKCMAKWMVVMQTAETPSVLALANASGVVDSCALGALKRNSGDLAPKLSELLAKNGLGVSDIEAIAVSIGPGGYTGLRVGLASALAFTLVRGAKLLAIPTLEGLAWQCPSDWTKARMVADALRGRFFIQDFAKGTDGWQAVSALELRFWNELEAPRSSIFSTQLAGPGIGRASAMGVSISPGAPSVPDVTGLWKAGCKRMAQNQYDNPAEVDILYGQPSSAEEQWKKLHPGSQVN